MTRIVDFDVILVVRMAGPLPSWNQFGHGVQDNLPEIAWALGILVATYAVSRVLSGRLRGALGRAGLQPNVALLLARVLWFGLWIVGILFALDRFTTGLAPLAAFIGVFGLAASLSLQTVLQNLVAGVYLLIERPFKLQDYIAVVGPGGANHEGRVEDIQMRTTHLRNRDNELILIPNFSIFSGVVTNRTAEGGLVQHLNLTFPRSTEVIQVRETMLPLLIDLPTVLDSPRPLLRVDKVEADAWTGSLSLWSRSPEGASDAVWLIGQRFPDATVTNGVAVP